MNNISLKVKRFVRRMFSEDVKTIAIFLLLIVTIWNVYAMALGQLAGQGLSFNTPSIDLDKRAGMQDSDGDLLPDVIESADRGTPVLDEFGQKIGTGTGTDPNDSDTDNDGFTDGTEDNLGTNPNNFWSPGYIWVLWSLVIISFVINRYREEDQLKEYQEFEQLHGSSSVTEGGSKFAHGGSSIFAKRTDEMTEEEKTKAIQSDARFHRMTGEFAPPPKAKKKLIKMKTIIQVIVVIIIVFSIQYIRSN